MSSELIIRNMNRIPSGLAAPGDANIVPLVTLPFAQLSSFAAGGPVPDIAHERIFGVSTFDLG